MANRIAENIRKIVGYDKIQKDLKALEEKIALLGRRGIGYGGPVGEARSVSGGTGTSNDPATVPETYLINQQNGSGIVGNDATNNALTNSGLSPSGNGNQSPTPSNGGGGHVTASQLADGLTQPAADDPDAQEGAGYTNPNESYSNGESGDVYQVIKAIDYTDCTTGKQTSVRLDGFFVPPEGWTTPDEGPPAGEGEWYLGYRWTALKGGATPTYFSTLGGALADSLIWAFATAAPPPAAPLTGEGEWSTIPPSPSNINAVYLYKDTDGLNGNVDIISCVPCTVGVDDACTMVPPSSDTWPESDQTQVVRGANGTYQGHPKDPNKPTLSPSSNLNICFGGGRTATLTPISKGGTAFFETDGTGPFPKEDAIVTLVNSDGSIRGYTDAAGLAQHRPTIIPTP